MTSLCGTNGDLTAMQVAFDAAENWYNGTGNPPGGNEFDFKSVATHESMHATGWSGHFGSGSPQCSGGGDQTMCPLLTAGTNGWRSLETHDKHTLVNAYPQ